MNLASACDDKTPKFGCQDHWALTLLRNDAISALTIGTGVERCTFAAGVLPPLEGQQTGNDGWETSP